MGGNVFDTTRPIMKDEVPSAVLRITNFLITKIGLDDSDLSLVGSAGKKKKSGDIDIAISKSALENVMGRGWHTPGAYLEDACSRLNLQAKTISAGDIVSVAFPIEFDETFGPSEFVQVDFMITDNMDFTKWMLYSPESGESGWSSSSRNALLSAVANSHKDDKLVWAGSFKVCEWVKPMLNYNTGLYEARQTLLNAKKTGLLRSPKTVSKDFITNDPDEIVERLFGPYFRAKDLMTFEDVMLAIHSSNFVSKKPPYEIILEYALNWTSNSKYGFMEFAHKLPGRTPC